MRQLKITQQVTNRETVSLDKYLHEISKEGLITADQEVELAKKIKQGDAKALEKLTRANLRFVVSVSKQYQNQGLTLSDLINEGNLGLIKAAQRFDETRGFKFISYAVWWIRQSILQALAEQSRIVRLPLNKIGSINKINKTFSLLEQEFEREPSADEIAEALDLPIEEVRESLKSNTRHISMDAPLGDEGDAGNMYDLMTSEDSPRPDFKLLDESLKEEINLSKDDLVNIINKKFPDFRGMFVELQNFKDTGELNSVQSNVSTKLKLDLYNILYDKSLDYEKIYNFLIKCFHYFFIPLLLFC